MVEMEEKFFRDNRFLDPGKKGNAYIYTIVLNRPFKKELFLELYAITDQLLAADGGANRIYEAFPESER